MKFLFDFFPLILFFIAFKMYDIYVATAATIAASAIQVGWLWLRHRRIERMPLITLIVLVIFGGATLLLQDETFVKWKPTVVNWLFGLVCLGSQFIGKKTILERMLGHAMELPSPVWVRLNFAWAFFFVAVGILNLFVAFNFDTETWVDFKVFGLTGLSLVFILAQSIYLARHLSSGPTTEE